ncbi:50S ribosomal protein L15 [Patescibacteria group bacterium]|nr:50S ribosomal protein L15 [Patescibacteria group bacterium]
MNLSSLGKIRLKKRAKRIGRGESSGRGKTSGRGTKGQKARGKIKPEFEGGQLPIIKRLPFQRGIGNKSLKKSVTITLDQLDRLDARSIVSMETLRKNKILSSSQNFYAKIVATGKISKPLIVKIRITKKAKKIIEAAKGRVEENV